MVEGPHDSTTLLFNHSTKVGGISTSCRNSETSNIGMQPNLSVKKVRDALLSLGNKLDEAEAIGICGSLARGDFNDKSDIDIFVIVKDGTSGMDRMWWDRINDVLKGFRRDITVLVYPIKALRRIINWYVLRLASEGIFVYDKGPVKDLFGKIIAAARIAGLVEKEIDGRKVWSAKNLKLGEKLIVEVKD